MLKPDYLDALPESLVALYSEVEQDILEDMARRISQYNYWIPSAEHQRQKLREMGLTQQDIINRLSKITGKSQREIKQLMQQACEDALDSDKAYYLSHGIDMPTKMSAELKAILNAGLKSTNQLFRNLTKTTASAGQTQFINALDKAWLQINSGAFDYNTAIRNAIKDLARQGLQAVRYPSGRADTLEVAIRRAVVTGVNQTAAQLQWQLADELGCDLVETTAHAGARPEHAVWQGQIFSRSGKHPKYPDFRSSTGYGTGAGLCGWNCRHSFNPYLEGSPRAYSDKLLEEYNAKKYTYNGKKLTEYEASQTQRYNERQIRRWKRENAAMQAAGLDTTESAMKLHSWQERQKDFIRQTGLKRQTDREQIAKVVDNLTDRDIIKLGKVNEDLLQKKSFEEVSQYSGKLSDRAVRKWYKYHDEQIPNLIDRTKSLEDQARQACELRNLHRTQARDLMRDQEARKKLDQTDPNRTFEELVEDKMKRKGLTREQAYEDILKTATKTRKSVNKSLGLED